MNDAGKGARPEWQQARAGARGQHMYPLTVSSSRTHMYMCCWKSSTRSLGDLVTCEEGVGDLLTPRRARGQRERAWAGCRGADWPWALEGNQGCCDAP